MYPGKVGKDVGLLLGRLTDQQQRQIREALGEGRPVFARAQGPKPEHFLEVTESKRPREIVRKT